MQVRRENDVDAVSRHSRAGRVLQVELALEAVDVGLLRRHLVAATGVDQHGARPAQQDAPHRHADAIAVVRRRLLLPERLRHDTEHRASVQVEKPVRDGDDVDIAETNGFGQLGGRSSDRNLLELDEHALCARWMDERHARTLSAGSRLLVDETHSALP